ncbi:hypothetical protein FB446DRAFT_699449 [Lentinula raphanica]|nr:hypothetical protein FB446DRAFT_699449 [Lentinula raphanica]
MTTESCYVYYCSGHGFGHGTRVSAFASQLLRLPEDQRPTVHIVSSAPSHVFNDSISLGALYRYADWIDPVIVQPLAYRVDRPKSIEVLQAFLKNKNEFLNTERQWLNSVKARCVLSDAAFLGCLAAKSEGIPSILITNFTFDSVYSYLATDFIDEHSSVHPSGSFFSTPDAPIPYSLIEPLISQIHAGYRCADLLLLLPGHIPIPSFSNYPSLPATDWVDTRENKFFPGIIEHLSRLKETRSTCSLHEHIPFPSIKVPDTRPASVRKIIPMPLLVRSPSPSSDRSPYTTSGRAQLLQSAGVPSEKHDPKTTRILVVSFGGQILKWPDRTHRPAVTTKSQNPKIGLGINSKTMKTMKAPPHIDIPAPDTLLTLDIKDHREIDPQPLLSPRLATPSHLWIPGAPPVVNPLSPAISASALSSPHPDKTVARERERVSPVRTTVLPELDPLTDIVNMPISPRAMTSGNSGNMNLNGKSDNEVGLRAEDMHLDSDESAINGIDQPQLLPDSSWIAIICGASDEQRSDISTLPENFYLAPKDVYMPDLTAIADVLLGKLGYGTVAECINVGTPMVYVSRPLFIEELGLKILLEKEGVGVEMSRADYEGGRWVERVKEAWEKTRVANQCRTGDSEKEAEVITERKAEIERMAEVVVDWVEDWWQGI